jgi:hypothetical protein
LKRPARWLSTSRTVILPLPACANSGQYTATGVSYPISLRSASMCSAVEATPLVVE